MEIVRYSPFAAGEESSTNMKQEKSNIRAARNEKDRAEPFTSFLLRKMQCIKKGRT